MMKILAITSTALLLAACAHNPPSVSVVEPAPGPRFPAAQFDCGKIPLSPNPTGATGKTAAKYEGRLGAWGQGCSDKLQSTGRELDAAGQVVR